MPAVTPYLHRLSTHGVLAVRGPDASKFLQGQLTCNLNYLSPAQASLGARCNLKGRMLASFTVAREGDDVLLIMPQALIEPLRADLAKYAVFSKVALQDEHAAWSIIGLSADSPFLAACQLTESAGSCVALEQGLIIRLHDGRALLCLHQGKAEHVIEQQLAEHHSVELNTWELANIQAGLGEVCAATQDLLIPQMLNLQSLGGVSFKKGCYTGQEIVARMQYLGRMKRHLQRLQCTADSPISAGMMIFSPTHSASVGEVVSAAHNGEHQELLAVVQDDAVADNQLTLGSLQGPALSLLTLPYSSDHERDITR
ncbi:CAF17-like 4Fe-4S cluster assembly/insertion protein YgfZ [Atopomonas sediminilitoris]|uniref:CAF17-like 4Fe-4S cluster assembly/insertion protein YgfZ n=1 Tax=Atopomonas sediminilitoris TaxID=2919919 RepID=UPI001F4DD116|nr:folate-binding protein [Atopomonas sediminilitoris]MCJ8168603.1 folate-binding protein [Atopomonas sediminilitoris]